jgi:Flp pilus assembly protein TadD
MLVPLLAVALLIRNEDYRSEVALWSRTAEQSPGKSRVWNNLGVACLQADDIRCARAAFDRALRLDPDNQRAAVNRYFLDHPVHGHP